MSKKLNGSWFGKRAPLNYLSAIFHPIKFFKCLKYPFLKIYNSFDGKFMGYAYTVDEQIPYGWRKAFGENLIKEIKEAGKLTRKRLHKHVSWKSMINFQEIKEKWGTLCLYASASDEIMSVLEKYEYLSQFYCIHCGKLVKYVTNGYILYICDDCEKKFKGDLSVTELSRKHDIPIITRFNKDNIVKVDVEKEYNIDLKELTRYWND